MTRQANDDLDRLILVDKVENIVNMTIATSIPVKSFDRRAHESFGVTRGNADPHAADIEAEPNPGSQRSSARRASIASVTLVAS